MPSLPRDENLSPLSMRSHLALPTASSSVRSVDDLPATTRIEYTAGTSSLVQHFPALVRRTNRSTEVLALLLGSGCSPARTAVIVDVILQISRPRIMNDNPYSTPSQLPAENGKPRDQSRSLWNAYLLAPAAAPTSFVALLFVVGATCVAFGVEINPASFLVLPVVAMIAGMIICYLVAGCLGMPIAFHLRKRDKLNGYTIHAAASGWSLLVSLVGLPAAIYGGAPWYQILMAPLLLLLVVAPPVLMSGTVFWWLVKRGGGLSTP